MAVSFQFLEGISGSPKSYRLGELRWSPGDSVTVQDQSVIAQLRGLPFFAATEIAKPAGPVPSARAPGTAAHSDPDLNAALDGSEPDSFDDDDADDDDSEEENGTGSPSAAEPGTAAKPKAKRKPARKKAK